MNITLQKILRKVESVQVGLLRVENKDEKLSLQARAGTNLDQLNCIVEKSNNSDSLLSRNVSLIQKDKLDYLYISCKVKEEIQNKTAVIMSMEILKACWFTRRSKGSVSWLQQKYSYEALSSDLDLAS